MLKKLIVMLISILSLSLNLAYAGELKNIEQKMYGLKTIAQSNDGLTYKQAKELVKNIKHGNGKTIEYYFSEKVSIPAIKDWGWTTFPLNNGGFNVRRDLTLNKDLELIYKWRVSPNGKVKPINGKAKSITRTR